MLNKKARNGNVTSRAFLRYNLIRHLKDILKQKYLFFFLIIFIPCWISVTAGAQDDNHIKYKDKRAFKAVAAPVIHDSRTGDSKLGFAWEYDTAQEAVDAAIAYCQSKQHSGPCMIQCEIIQLGEMPVRNQAALPKLQKDYEKKELARLKMELALTGERNIITRLSTILQKIGRYEESEALLYDLAMSGEHLAQNALAYHWAELEKRLNEALDLVNEAIVQDPHFFSYRDTKGLVLARLKRWEEAEASARLAVRLKPHPIALDHLGDILWLRGKPKDARHQWELAVKASQNILFKQRMEFKINNGMTGDIIFE